MLISKSGAFAKSLLGTLGADCEEHPESVTVHIATIAVTINTVIPNRPEESILLTGLLLQ